MRYGRARNKGSTGVHMYKLPSVQRRRRRKQSRRRGMEGRERCGRESIRRKGKSRRERRWGRRRALGSVGGKKGGEGEEH